MSIAAMARGAPAPKQARDAAASSGHLDVAIGGMSCAGCSGRVERAIAGVAGVESVVVNLATRHAHIALATGDPVTTGAIDAAIREAGYEPVESVVTLRIAGMSCASCVGRAERALAAVPGVIEASVNLATARASLRVLGEAPPLPGLVAAVAAAGYEAEPIGKAPDTADRERRAREAEIAGLRRSMMLAALATAPLLVFEMGAHMSHSLHEALDATFGMGPLRLVSFLLAGFVLAVPGLRFFRQGWPALLRGAPDMNSLVLLGTSAAFLYSTVATFAPGLLPDGTQATYFEAAAVIVTLILTGRWLEARAKGSTSEAIRKLMSLQPKSARLLRDGREIDVAIEAVAVGDIVVIRPGERLPADGEVVEGSSYVDEAMITGEPIPALKELGAAVTGGTVNGTGAFRFEARKVGADTLLSQILRTVETAQGSKLPIQALVDRVTMWFVPAVIGLSLVTFALWFVLGPSPGLAHAVVNAVAVLIIACPCAMGLATPTSIMVGTGRGAELGILFRQGEALQSLKDATVVALDKTGTLTRGKPTLTEIQVADGFAPDEVLSLVASVEARSEHPVAAAIVAEAARRGLSLVAAEGFTSEPGFGVAAQVGGRRVEIGADLLMRRLGLDLTPFAADALRLGQGGATPLYASVDGALAAIIAVADPLKVSTPAAIDALHQLGLRVVMITGDNRHTADAIASRLGIREVMAEVLPTGKADAVATLQAGGVRVAFVGDGINDAPALAQADVGIAIGTGADIAIESADVVLMSGDLSGVAAAIALSQATIGNIRQNLAWAFGYNVVLIPVAAGVLYPLFGILMSPMVAGLAMALSSVSVVANALRLKRFAPPVAARAGSTQDESVPA